MKTPLQKTQNDLRIARNTLWEHGYGDAGQVLHTILAKSYEYQLDEIADNLDRINYKKVNVGVDKTKVIDYNKDITQ